MAAALGLKHYSGAKCKELYEDLIPKIFGQTRQQMVEQFMFDEFRYNHKVLEEYMELHFPFIKDKVKN